MSFLCLFRSLLSSLLRIYHFLNLSRTHFFFSDIILSSFTCLLSFAFYVLPCSFYSSQLTHIFIAYLYPGLLSPLYQFSLFLSVYSSSSSFNGSFHSLLHIPLFIFFLLLYPSHRPFPCSSLPSSLIFLPLPPHLSSCSASSFTFILLPLPS